MRLFKPLTLKDLGQVKPDRACHEIYIDSDGQQRTALRRLRVWTEQAGYIDVHPYEARCSLTVRDWMVTKLHPSTWRAIVNMFD